MGKVKHIILREYLTRVRKRSFIIMTIVGPLLFAALMIVPTWLAQLEDQEEKKIAVVEYDRFGQPVPDSLMLFRGVIPDKDLLKFSYLGNLSERQVEALAGESAYYGFVVIRYNVIMSGQDTPVEFLSNSQPSLGIESHISSSLEKYLHNRKLLAYDVPPDVVNALKTKVDLRIRMLDKDGYSDEGLTTRRRAVGYIGGMLIYMFIFFFGAQVMRGVVEEKTNRIIEVVITSVKPFQLMLGKIIGIGLVGLTQFMVWIVLTVLIYQFSGYFIMSNKLDALQIEETQTNGLFEAPIADNMEVQQTETKISEQEVSDFMDKILELDPGLLLGAFIFFFIGGYLLYAAMFAAIGSAVDNETDTQQFMMPVTIPLILSIVVMMNAVANPSGQLAFWFSMIPFTSPIVMMARIPFGVPTHQVIASMSILVATFILFTWLAGKIYRTGILMYGKKVNFREIVRWMRYK